jgi:hypothetical protein
MKSVRLRMLFFPALILLVGAGAAFAQTFPVVRGTTELQVGGVGVVMPEDSGGMISLEPEVRFGYFIGEGLQVQLAGDVRVWPLGVVAPANYSGAVSVLWFPNLGPQSRDMYLLVGAGGAYSDPPGPQAEGEFDPLFRFGLGVKVPLGSFLLLERAHLTMEYRGDVAFQDETDFLSGIGMGLSFVR